MCNLSLKVFYTKGIRIHIKNKSFKEAMHLIWTSPAFCDYDPIKLVFDSTKKTLYMDKQAFMSYLEGNLTVPELIELTECDELYRNRIDYFAENGSVIDAGSLWKKHNKELTLIDDDNIFTPVKADISIFEIVE